MKNLRFFRNLSIANKLVFLFLLLGIGSTVLVGVYSYYSARQSLTQRTFDQLTSIRVAKKNRIESFFADRFRDIVLFARTTEVSEMLNKLDKIKDVSNNTAGAKFGEYASFLNSYVISYGYYEQFIVMNSEHKMLYSATNTSDSLNKFSIDSIRYKSLQKLFKNVTDSGKTVFCDFAKDDFNNNKPSFYLIAPIKSNSKKTSGALALKVSFKAINNIMLESTSEHGLGESGESYLVGNDFLMRSTSRFRPNSILSQKVKTVAAINALNGKSGTEIISDYRNIQVLSSYSNLEIPGVNWAIMAEIDLEEAMVPVIGIRNDIFFLCFVFALFIIGFAYIIARTISLPIIRLKNAALHVGGGNFDTRVDISGKDEIGALAQSFNLMIEQINNASYELREREERLSHFYEATVDGIILHDNGKLILLNQALVRLTGFSEQELLKKHLSEIIVLPTVQTDSQESPQIAGYETLCIRKDGTSINVEVQEGKIEYQGKSINATVIRDITQRKQVESELFEERSKRLSALIDGQEMERQRFSRELHDGLGQQMIAIKLKLESISNQQCIDNNQIMKQLQELFDNAIDEARRISDNLMPSILKEFGLETALKRLCSDASISSGISISFESFGYNDNLNPKATTYLYRIAQEAINNCIKHAKANEISIQLIGIGNFLRLIIQDNGKGFTINNNYIFTGNGLYNMRERVNLLKGIIEFDTSEGNGTTITVKIPIDKNTDGKN